MINRLKRYFLLVHILTLIFTQYSVDGGEFPGNDFFQSVHQAIYGEDTPFDHKCGFPYILYANGDPGSPLYHKLQMYMKQQPQLDSTYVSPSGRFLIKYTNEGIHAIPDYDRNQNGTKDYLEFVANSFDRAWAIEIDSLHFIPPRDTNGNPREVYPVECMLTGTYGTTELLYEIESLPGLNYVTKIKINTDFALISYPHAIDDIARDSMAIAVTAAHEFNHAIHSSYRLWPDNSGFFEDIWFIESSAVYMEEIVADEVNDYVFGSINYVQEYMNHTDKPLDGFYNIGTDYGKVLFNIVLGERYGSDITCKIWSEILNTRALPALKKVLSDKNTHLKAELNQLALWMYYTGSRATSGPYFPDASIFPEMDLVISDTIITEKTEILRDTLPRLSFLLYSSPNLTQEPRGMLLRLIDGLANSISVIYLGQGNNMIIIPASIGYYLPTPFLVDGLTYSIVNAFDEGEEQFVYQLLSQPKSGATSEEISVFPQPFHISDQQPFLTFMNVPDNAKINIYSANGRFLRTLDAVSNQNFVIWDLVTDFGEKVGSGVFIYRVVSDSEEKTGKFVILR
jgi:hypothetical protein